MQYLTSIIIQVNSTIFRNIYNWIFGGNVTNKNTLQFCPVTPKVINVYHFNNELYGYIAKHFSNQIY